MASEKMQIWNALKDTPEHAKYPITSGPLKDKGFTEIDPEYKLEKLTELFGPAGIGWRIDLEDVMVENTANGPFVICVISLYIIKKTGNWSEAIPGVGSFQMISGDAVKMAYTDAISVATRALGLGADVYSKTKYSVIAPMSDEEKSYVDNAALKFPNGPYEGRTVGSILLDMRTDFPKIDLTPYPEDFQKSVSVLVGLVVKATTESEERMNYVNILNRLLRSYQ